MLKLFDVETQYQLYLQRVNLKEEHMHPQQRVQLKQAFFGAAGQLLLLMRDDITKLYESEAIDTMTDMMNQVLEFWETQV